MEHEPEERTKRSRFKNKFYVELQRDGEDIVEKYYDIVKHHTGFNLDFDIEKQGEIYVCSFYLMSEDYPETDLYLNSVASLPAKSLTFIFTTYVVSCTKSIKSFGLSTKTATLLVTVAS